MRVGVVAVVGVVMVGVVAMVGGSQEGAQRCRNKSSQCDDCLQTPGCVWCTEPKEGVRNCQHRASTNLTSFCDPENLQDLSNDINIVQDDELTVRKRKDKGNRVAQENIIQLKPQRIKLRLRKGVSQNVEIKYRRALAYPVDLYYLMDLSNSMKDDKQQLEIVSHDLAEALNNLTDQYQIGFGSFVDKVLLPYTDKKRLSCATCAKPYSFRNDMKLNNDPDEFKRGVRNAIISGNLDSPEGGFDALMQAMVCTEEIGWREVARRILVFSTDASFHQAGDGRLAGVVEPNDGMCHLNSVGEYTEYDKYDYPSIGQIVEVSKEKGIYVIFAVLSYKNLYEDLSKQSHTFSHGQLDSSSSNVVDLIKKQYNSISGEVILTDNSTEDVSIVYSSACGGGVVTQTNKCGNIKENDVVTFNLEVTANRCPANGKGSVVEVKTLEDKVILDIEVICSCDCPVKSDRAKCMNHGDLECGVCKCDDGYFGTDCRCGGGDYNSAFSGGSEDLTKQCKASENDTMLCSGRGYCECGNCFCRHKHVTGYYCECDQRKCFLDMDQECSGNGVCECDKCKCDPGYTGVHCECRDDTACKQPGSDKVCSGHGTCECGKCRCTGGIGDTQETYTGKYCEDCLRCGTGKCSQFRDCVECIHFGNGPRQNDCNTCEKYEAVESLDAQVYKDARLCTFEDEDGCYVNFTYRYLEREGRDEVFVQAERQCPEPPPVLPIVFGVIGAIVAIGIITLLIWKILTTIHDQREYAKFEKESKNAKFNAEENPLYKSASTTVQNPAFTSQEAY